MTLYRPCRAEIDLSAFRRNIQTLRKTLPESTQLLTVVKANAYGHGAVAIAQAAERESVAYLGVSSLEEGVELRQAGLKMPILVLGSLFPFENFPVLFDYQLTPTIASLHAAGQDQPKTPRLSLPQEQPALAPAWVPH